jgi:hypothetical protein
MYLPNFEKYMKQHKEKLKAFVGVKIIDEKDLNNILEYFYRVDSKVDEENKKLKDEVESLKQELRDWKKYEE